MALLLLLMMMLMMMLMLLMLPVRTVPKAIFDWDNLFATLLVASGASNSTTERPTGMATASEEPTFSGATNRLLKPF